MPDPSIDRAPTPGRLAADVPPSSRLAAGVPSSSRLAASGGMIALVLIWGSYFPVVGVLLGTWDPFLMSAVRVAFAALALCAILVAVEGWSSLTRPTPWGKVCLLGAVGMGFNVLAFAVAIDWSGAVATSLISGGGPAIAALMGHVFYRERLTPWGWFAVAITVGGAGLIVLGGDALEISFRGGEVLVLLGYIAWYWYAAASQRWLKDSSQLRSSALTMAVAAVVIGVVSALGIAAGVLVPRASASVQSLVLLAYSGGVSVGLGLVLWNIGVKRLGLAVASFYVNLAPVMAVALGVWLGGSLTWTQAFGGALVILAVICIQSRGVASRGL